MKIILTKSTKLALKGNKSKKLIFADGKEIEVTEDNGVRLIESGLAIDPSLKVVKTDESSKIIEELKSEIGILSQEKEILLEDISDQEEEIKAYKSKIEELESKSNDDLLGSDK